MSAARQAQRGVHEPTLPVDNMICEAISVKSFTTDDLDDWLPTGNTTILQSHMKTT